MKTKSKELNEKQMGMVVLYYNGEPITMQCPDSKKLNGFLFELRLALADSADYNKENGFPNIANSNFDLRNLLKVASLNIALL